MASIWLFKFVASTLGRKAMTDLDSILKSRDITLLTQVCIVKAMVFPVIMSGCESWTTKKARRRRIDIFKLWCWRRLLRVLWTARRSNQSILKEINTEYWEDWCWSWSSNILAIWCKEQTHWKRPWCWERLKAKEGGSRGWDGWMASPIQWTSMCMYVKVTQLCPSLYNPMNYTVHGILQARILERLAVPFSRGSSQPRDRIQVSHIAGVFFTSWATGKSKNTGVGSLPLLQRIFPTQELNWGLLHCRWILYQLSY